VFHHCNSGSRVDAEEAIWTLLPLGIRTSLQSTLRVRCLYATF
jgi:hypothetical protein